MTPERDHKWLQRALRTIPVEAIAPDIAAQESTDDALWCLVDGALEFVPANGSRTVTEWCDPLHYAQFVRWVQAHPERVHDTHESAVAIVQSKLGKG